MSKKSESAEQHIKSVKRRTRRKYSAEEKIRIVLEGMRGEHSIAELCRREGIAQSQYYSWSKDFMEAGKKRLAGDTQREARSDEVVEMRREMRDLKEVVADLTPADVYFGRGDEILQQRAQTKRRTMKLRRLHQARSID